MSPEFRRKKLSLEVEITRLHKACTYINKLRTAMSEIKDIKLKNYYSEQSNIEINKVRPQLAQLKILIQNYIDDEIKSNEPIDFNIRKIQKELNWL